MSERSLYVLGLMVIITGLAGIITGSIVGTPGSIVLGLGLVVSSTWMLSKMHSERERKNSD